MRACVLAGSEKANKLEMAYCSSLLARTLRGCLSFGLVLVVVVALVVVVVAPCAVLLPGSITDRREAGSAWISFGSYFSLSRDHDKRGRLSIK